MLVRVRAPELFFFSLIVFLAKFVVTVYCGVKWCAAIVKLIVVRISM